MNRATLAACCLLFLRHEGNMPAMTGPKLKVAIQGERGAFSHEAALLALGEGIEAGAVVQHLLKTVSETALA